MGQKVHPVGIRLGIAKDWASTWYANTRGYATNLVQDLEVRAFLRKKLAQASVSRIEIKRAVEEGFKVKVASVRTLQMTGKTVQRGRIQGKRRDWKKAIVKLMPGERIEFFEGA